MSFTPPPSAGPSDATTGEALAAPRRNSVGVCGATVQDVETTVVLVFTDDEGGYLATVY